MNFDWIVENRKSVRRFSKSRANWKDVLDAIDLANQGPFSGNHNHLKFIIIESEDSIRSLADVCEQEWIKSVPLLVIVTSDDSHLENTYGERGRVYSRQQAGAAIQTMLLKFTELGLGSCWIGAYEDSKIRKKLGMPEHVQVEAIIAVGHEEGMMKKPKKKDLNRSLYWESWGNDKRPLLFNEGEENYRPD